MDLQNFLNTVHYRHGRNGQVSLFLYQSVMFAATAFVDIKALCQAGYNTRKEARGKFFQKARVSLVLSVSRPVPDVKSLPIYEVLTILVAAI